MIARATRLHISTVMAAVTKQCCMATTRTILSEATCTIRATITVTTTASCPASRRNAAINQRHSQRIADASEF